MDRGREHPLSSKPDVTVVQRGVAEENRRFRMTQKGPQLRERGVQASVNERMLSQEGNQNSICVQG